MPTPKPLPHGAISRAATRLGNSRDYIGKLVNGDRRASPELAVAILTDEELCKAGLDFLTLTGVQIPAGTPLGGGVVAVSPPSPGDRPAATSADSRTLPMSLEGRAP